MSLWRRHPGVRSGDQLSLGERAADKMRNGMGSWGFVGSFLAFMAGWAAVNGIALAKGFDPYPFILLNLFLSMLAGLQGAILLIAAKRQDQIAGELALHDHQMLEENTELTKQVERLASEVHAHILGEKQ